MAADPRLKREKERAANEKKQKEEEKKKAQEEKAEKERLEREQMEAELAKKKAAEGMSCCVHVMCLLLFIVRVLILSTCSPTLHRISKEGRQETQGATEEATS